MKNNLMIFAVMSLALMTSCNGNKTAQNAVNNDSVNVADTAVNENIDYKHGEAKACRIAQTFHKYRSLVRRSVASTFAWVVVHMD